MIKDIKPKDFSPKFEVVSCFIEYEGKILMLKRQTNKPQGDTWSVPSGKKDNKESLIQALIREVKEETGIKLIESDIYFYKTKYVEYNEYQFIYHVFSCSLDEFPDVIINSVEHQKYLWEYPDICLKLNLIQDEDECIIDFYKLKTEKDS